ncbi:TetR/AcrR family transcriptional regulator [Paenibacillus sp. HN-1]|uniref:TetR/AcrR family transcriptional regulator n=1 Tax=Paenibacillus TaxID=44249 RepID=UPI001CA85756|nr:MULTISPECIES: TetR/AcrR family transcriptional regulator [Paenibacillus]MBY9080615.1 TetR/AcrR family transcriptional regulator [Paenibacillus sp. CGMCC 1.18879]MBY9085440.1 TetR/AcrR family transcriptional regulator [Paenibacillus sinensis]
METKNGFEKRAEMIRRKIINTTLEMLKTWEPKRMRVADIAKEAGVSQVTIYNYFGSKEKLIDQTFRSYLDMTIERFERFMDKPRSVRDFIHFSMEMEREQYSAFRPEQIKTLMIDDQEMFGYVQERYAGTVLPLMIKLVEDGKASGEISPKVSVNAVLAYMNMYIRSSSELLELAQKQEDLNAFLDELTHLFFYGLCGREE